MTLAALRTNVALWVAWWRRRPSLTQRPDYSSPAAVEKGRATPAIALPPEAQQCVQWLPRELWPRLNALRRAAEGESACGTITLVLALSYGRAQELRAIERRFEYRRRA